MGTPTLSDGPLFGLLMDLNSILCFFTDIPHYYLYNLFYYLSDTYNDSS